MQFVVPLALGCALLLAGCSREAASPRKAREEPSPPPAQEPSSAAEPQQQHVEPPAPPPPSPEELAAIEAADRSRRDRAKRLFNDVMEPVTEAVRAYDEHDELDESAWFGRDQEDNLEHIDELLDEAIRVLGVSEIAETRSEIRRLEQEIAELEKKSLVDREARLSAPTEEELGRLEKTFKTSREQLDQRLEEAAEAIEAKRERIEELHEEFVVQMRAIGVDLDEESARSLLSTVTGDDFVEMCVVFDNVRGVTVQLQELTEASGESLDAAKRYYGSYVVLIHMMDRIQRDFVRRVRNEMLPRLERYAQEAQRIIDAARRNMEAGGDRAIAEQNIRSNRLTIDAAQLYSEYLRAQAHDVQERNERLQIDLRDAQNTYDTVVLSSEVAELLREGSRNFAALLELDVPALRGFENAELKAEFERLTLKMNSVN